MKSFKVGDVVTVRKDLKVKKYGKTSIATTPNMLRFSGQKLRIKRITKYQIYLDCDLNDSYDWAAEMFEEFNIKTDNYGIY